MKNKSIKVSMDVYTRLDAHRQGRDTFDSIIARLLDVFDQLSRLREIAEAGDREKQAPNKWQDAQKRFKRGVAQGDEEKQ